MAKKKDAGWPGGFAGVRPEPWGVEIAVWLERSLTPADAPAVRRVTAMMGELWPGIDFWVHGQVEDRRVSPSEISEAQLAQSLTDEGWLMVYNGYRNSNRSNNLLVRLEYNAAGIPARNAEFLHACARLYVNGALFADENIPRCVALVDDAVRTMSALPGVFHGLVDVSDVKGTGNFSLRAHTRVGPFSYGDSVWLLEWLGLGHRRVNTASGVWWGNILGPGVLKKVGPGPALVKEFRAVEADDSHSRRQHAEVLASGAAYLRVGPSPLDIMQLPIPFEDSISVVASAWLRRRLRDAGCLL